MFMSNTVDAAVERVRCPQQEGDSGSEARRGCGYQGLSNGENAILVTGVP